ncbi:MAG: peptide deformylase [Proteobacteria bacterium]|nr:peptide deformylase [Pseudomonadota bacterium]
MQIIRKTIEHDLAYLRQISAPVDFDDKNLAAELTHLAEYARKTACFALAAVQIGIPKRILYLKDTSPDMANYTMDHDEARVIVNPKIISRRGHTKYWEACLSCLDNTGLVSRPYEIVLEYFDADGTKHTDTFMGFESTVVSHEMDHFDGILHMDIAEKNLYLSKEERMQLRESEPYQVISKTCDFEAIAREQAKRARIIS